jgi:hypothetical protein
VSAAGLTPLCSAFCVALLLSFLATPVRADEPRNDVVVREVFRCEDEAGHERAFSYHLNRRDYGYVLWVISTKFDFRDLSTLGRMMEPQKMDLATIVIYDTREDGSPERLDVVEARAAEILSGVRTRIAYDGPVHGGPYTIVQEPDKRRFDIDHRGPYQGGSQGRVHISIEPVGGMSSEIGGFVRSERISVVNDNVRLRACAFNRAPVQLRLR